MNEFWTNLGSSLTGNVHKAILCVRDKNVIEEDRSKQISEESSMVKTIWDANETSAALLGATETSTKMQALAGTTTASPSYSKIKTAAAQNGYLAMEVQYNPSSLSFDTEAGMQVRPMGGNAGAGANQQLMRDNAPAATTLRVQLIFDDVNPADAFTLQNNALFTPTVGNVINSIGNLAKTHSVQAQIDGIMSLLTLAQTRQVIFAWSKLCFRGELFNVSSRYTMFNKHGNPVRGVVEMSIRQQSNISSADDQYWDEAFEMTFPKTTGGNLSGQASKLEKITQNTFLNF